jgi:hypothetical protein
MDASMLRRLAGKHPPDRGEPCLELGAKRRKDGQVPHSVEPSEIRKSKTPPLRRLVQRRERRSAPPPEAARLSHFEAVDFPRLDD